MRKLLDTLYWGCGCLGALSVLAICVVMIGQSLGRIVGVPTGGANDLVAWLCAAAAFLPMAHAFKHGDFVRVTFVLDKLHAPAQRVLEALALCAACIAIAYLAWWATVFTFESWQFSEIGTGMLAWPLWIPQLSFALGSILLLIAVVDEFIIVLRGGVPTFVREVAERHARGDFSSEV